MIPNPKSPNPKIVTQLKPTPAPGQAGPSPVQALFQKLSDLVDLLRQEDMQARVYESVTLQNTADTVYAEPANLLGYYFYNTAATVRYVKLFDFGPGLPVVGGVGGETPRITFGVPPAGGANVVFPRRMVLPFWRGIAVAATTGSAFNDSGNPSSGDIIVNLFYVPRIK